MRFVTWRSRRLLDLVREAPECFACGEPNRVGNIVPAHSNQSRDGKGKGLKAHDYRVAALCNSCHQQLDQGNKWTLQEKRMVFDEAHRATIGWLIESERLIVRD